MNNILFWWGRDEPINKNIFKKPEKQYLKDIKERGFLLNVKSYFFYIN